MIDLISKDFNPIDVGSGLILAELKMPFMPSAYVRLYLGSRDCSKVFIEGSDHMSDVAYNFYCHKNISSIRNALLKLSDFIYKRRQQLTLDTYNL